MGESSGMAELGLRLVGSLAVVVGLLILVARLVNRRFKPADGAPVRVVHRQPLTRGSGVAVVTVGTRVLVLGTTEQQVTLLTEIEPDEIGLDDDYDALLGDAADGTGERPSRAAAAAGPFAPSTGGLSGSVLSAQTWKQAWAAFGARGTTATTGATDPADLTDLTDLTEADGDTVPGIPESDPASGPVPDSVLDPVLDPVPDSVPEAEQRVS